MMRTVVTTGINFLPIILWVVISGYFISKRKIDLFTRGALFGALFLVANAVAATAVFGHVEGAFALTGGYAILLIISFIQKHRVATSN